MDTRSELRMCLAHEYTSLLGWLCHWLDLPIARWVTWQAFCDLVAMAIGQVSTEQGPYATLCSLARGRMQDELNSRGEPPAENTELWLTVPAFPDLRHFALHYAQMACLPRLTEAKTEYWYNLVTTLRTLSNRAMPVVALFAELENPDTEIGDLPGLVTLAQHYGKPCGPGCTVTEKMCDREGTKSVQWARQRTPLIGVSYRGQTEQDRGDLGRNPDQDEHLVQSDGGVRDAEPRTGVRPTPRTVADHRGDWGPPRRRDSRPGGKHA
jgi:hypothetical protein